MRLHSLRVQRIDLADGCMTLAGGFHSLYTQAGYLLVTRDSPEMDTLSLVSIFPSMLVTGEKEDCSGPMLIRNS